MVVKSGKVGGAPKLSQQIDRLIDAVESKKEANFCISEDCIGAIYGVHVPASIPSEDQIPYIGRKGTPTQNIVVVCNFDMQFIFVVAGWEDVGYPQMDGYLGPYKGERYHLPDFHQGSQPIGYQYVFNHAHSSLRSVIECTFGVWKKKWKILRDMSNYPFDKQVKIVIETMAIHNDIRRHAQHDYHFEKIENDPDFVLEEDNERDDDFQEENHNANIPGAR
ncbi:hypothetical protein Ddye_023893 [Dipteronia dyeriana]|uniref:DDE Tnp4 domain-containing protein n=1 Tax=Dipteronia dyeriana TaxID=168575 RepID=A0AAD9TUR5_9ROSI|nr:hypothetical protein Ddye_023893 [Dipteronia dyeriana]